MVWVSVILTPRSESGRGSLALTGIGVEAFLHRLPEVGRNDLLMLARVYLALVGDLTGVDRVVQHLVKVAARERQPAAESAAILMALGDQPEVIGFLFEKVDAAQLQVEGKHLPDHLGLGSVDHQLLVSAVITEGYGAAHPHALPFRGGDLVTDPLAGDLALELGEGKQHVEGQPPHRGGGIELLGDRHERNLVGIEHLDDLGEVGKRTGQSVDLVDHHRIDLVGLNAGEKPLQGRPVQGAAGQATVVVGNGQRGPAHPPLGLDVGLAGFALGMERVELLLCFYFSLPAATSWHIGSLPVSGRVLAPSPEKHRYERSGPAELWVFVERGGRRPVEVDPLVAREILRDDGSGEQRVIATGDDAGGHVEEPLAAQECRQGFVGVDAAAMEIAVSVGQAAQPLGAGGAPYPELDGGEGFPEAGRRPCENGLDPRRGCGDAEHAGAPGAGGVDGPLGGLNLGEDASGALHHRRPERGRTHAVRQRSRSMPRPMGIGGVTR